MKQEHWISEVLFWLLMLAASVFVLVVGSCTTPSDPVADRRDEIPNSDIVVGNVYKRGEVK